MDKPTDIEFCPTHDDCFSAFMKLLPRGRAWDSLENSLERNTNIRRFMSGIAKSWAGFEDQMCLALNEWFCFSSVQDIDLWNLDYGIPDECDLYNASVCTKAEAFHSISADSLEQLLFADGYNTEMRWLKGNDEEYPGVRSTLNVMVDPHLSPAFVDRTLLPFHVGTGRLLGAPLDVSAITCMLERYIPAHCVIQTKESGVWAPVASLGAKLLAWWNADDTPDGDVTSWVDRIAGMNATPVNSSKPVSVPGGVGGQRFITFNGTDQALRVNSAGSVPDNMSTLVILGSQEADAATDATERLMILEGTNAGNSRSVGRVVDPASSPDPAFNRLNTLSSGTTLRGTSQDLTGMFVAVVRREPTVLSSRLKGLPSVPPSVTITSPPSTAGKITIGGSYEPTSARFHKGKIRHIFLCQNMTMPDIISLEAWNAWDVLDAMDLLPPTHPYRNMRP